MNATSLSPVSSSGDAIIDNIYEVHTYMPHIHWDAIYMFCSVFPMMKMIKQNGERPVNALVTGRQ